MSVLTLFFSITIALSIPTIIILSPVQFAEFEPYFLGTPYMALQSAMACRVFRQIRIGLMTDFDGTMTKLEPTAVHFAQAHSVTERSFEFQSIRDGPINVQVQRRPDLENLVTHPTVQLSLTSLRKTQFELDRGVKSLRRGHIVSNTTV
jgi:hypothetical protein